MSRQAVASPARRAGRRLLLFIAGDGPNSQLAQANLKTLQETEKQYEFVVEIVDVLQNFRAAQEHGVLVTPCLILLEPPPQATIVGTLKDAAKVRAALRLEGNGSSDA